MSWFVVVLLAAALVTLIYGVMVYNSLVTIKHNVSKAWANLDVLLKQRHDELPKLVEVCKQYRQFEQDTLTKVIEARSRVFAASQQQNMPALGQAETQLRLGVANLFAVAEAYPDLKTNEQFLNLEARISALENAIADRREFYNESVNINNVSIEQFPELVIARLFKFKAFDLLQFGAEELKDVDIGQRFKT